MENLYQSGVCTWPDCGLPFINYTAFRKHLNYTHKLNDNTAEQAQGQMQLVEGLMTQLQHEKERLAAMMRHLKEDKDGMTIPAQPYHPDRLYYRDMDEEPPYELTDLIRRVFTDTKSGRTYTYSICEWLKKNFCHYRNLPKGVLLKTVETVLNDNPMFIYTNSTGLWMLKDEEQNKRDKLK